MGKTLVIAEKPSVAADIARTLGNVKREKDHYEGENYIISSAVGHLLEIKAPDAYEVKRGKWSFEHLPVIPPHFDLQPIKSTEAKLKSLAKLIRRKDVDKIINACDAGREGELIFRYIMEAVKVKKPIERLWLQSMTRASIAAAFNQLRTDEEMQNLADAAKSRSEADWLVGINGTRAMTAFNSQSGGFFLTTVGRVQTPTLALVVKREEAIRSFVAQDFWEVHANFSVSQGSYSGRYIDPKFKKDPKDSAKKQERLWNAAQAEKIVAACQGKTGVVSETSKPTSTACPLLYNLTALQREANSRYGFSAKTTLNIAQALYEKHKVLTYPRTDSRALPNDYIYTVKETLGMLQNTQWGKHAELVLQNNWVKPNRKIFDNSKISDHFAIIPTTQAPGKSLSDAEQKIYDMVVKRFIAIFYPPAQYKQITRSTEVAGYTFLTEGKVLESAGWLAVYNRKSSAEDNLCPITNGEKSSVEEIHAEKLTTTPPPRYTDASLLSAMENAGKEIAEEDYRQAMSEKGIGTPATRAAIIDGLITQNYMIRDGRDLIPTAKARQLISLLYGLKIKVLSEAELTGEWEYQLAQIEKGKLSRADFMKGISDLTRDIVSKASSFGQASVPIENPAHLKTPCPKCGGEMVEHYRRYACQKCDYSLPKHPGGRLLDPNEADTLLSTGKLGPVDGFISKMGRPFTATIHLGPAPDYKVDFDFGDKEKTSTPADLTKIKQQKPVGLCPICKKPVLETETSFACEDHLDSKAAKKCSFRTSKTILQQPISREQMEKLLSTGSTDLLEGFVSNRTHRKFSAFLVLGKDGKVNFKFEDKPKKTVRKTAAKTKTAKKKSS